MFAFVIQFTQSITIEEYDPTIESLYTKTVVIDGETCVLDIMDTAGQDEFPAINDQYMKTGEGFILIFSIDNMESFEYIESKLYQIRRVKDDDEFPVVCKLRR